MAGKKDAIIDRSRTLHAGLGLWATLLVAFALFVGGARAAADEPVKLGLKPVDAEGAYFTLIMAPGESRALTVEIGNHGAGPVQARTFAADAYTIINGGFAARLDGEPTSGTTTWLDFPTQTLDLEPGMGLNQSFTVRVPADARPGEYLTSLVVQNAIPIAGDGGGGDIVFNQVLRQVIAVAITIPGPRAPGLAIGQATHRTVTDRSSVAVALQNTGNVRLKPIGQFTLFDLTGQEISRYPITMDSFYAGTDTFVEVPFAQRLNPGDYTVTLALSDEGEMLASSGSLAFRVPPAEADLVPQPLGTTAQLAPVNQTLPQPGAVPWPWILAIVGFVMVGLGWALARSGAHPAHR